MTPTCFECIPNPGFRDICPTAPDGMPRGNILEISCNPFNGQFVFTFQRSAVSLALIERALDFLECEYGSFGNFARPVIEAEPRCLLRAVG